MEHILKYIFSDRVIFNETPRSKSPTRQSRYDDGTLQGMPAKANKFQPNISFAA
jgi:hypothetical protein